MHCAWTCTCSRNAWIKTIQRQPPPKMLRLIQNQWIWPSLTLTCLQAHVVALQELHKAMSRWICLFFNSISKFLNLSFYQNCRKIIVLRFWKGKTSNTTIATCNCNSRNLPLGLLCLRQCFLNPSLSSVEWSASTTQLQKLSHCSAQSVLQKCGALPLCSSCQALWWW